jgi:hypothetical protein
MQKMVDIVKTELDWLDMSINIQKSVCLRIGRRFNAPTSEIVIDNIPIKACREFKYLGMYIVSGKSVKLNLHQAKMKYFRSLNGILGKIGSTCPINVTLSLVNSFATPVLLYGLETACFNASEVKSLNYPFNSIFVKLFSTFNSSIIQECQYYTGYLPFKYILNLRCLTFLKSLLRSPLNARPAGLLFHWFGSTDWNVISSPYNILPNDVPTLLRRKIWLKFQADIHTD